MHSWLLKLIRLRLIRLPDREEIVVCRVVDTRRRSCRGLRTTGLGRNAARSSHTLYARDLAERTFRPYRLRAKQQPGDGIGRWRVGTFLHCTQDLAAIGRFPMWAGIVSADPVSASVKEIGFGSHKRPFVFPNLVFSRAAF